LICLGNVLAESGDFSPCCGKQVDLIFVLFVSTAVVTAKPLLDRLAVDIEAYLVRMTLEL
jgi:hypothetical protein